MVQVLIFGNLGGDAKVTTLEDGRLVYNFSIADNAKILDKDSGELKEVANWFNCSYFTKSEKIGAYLKKGNRMLVQGSLVFREYFKDGRVGRSNDVTVNNLQIVDFDSEGDNNE